MNIRRTIKKSKRFDVLKRDNFTCQYCGRSAPDVELEIDHITPVSKGGSNNIDNLITSCKDCNRAKRDQMLEFNPKSKKIKELFDEYIEEREKTLFDRYDYLLGLPEKIRFFILTLERLYDMHGKECILGFINKLFDYFVEEFDENTIKIIKNDILFQEIIPIEVKFLLLESPSEFVSFHFPGKFAFLSEIWYLVTNDMNYFLDGTFHKGFDLFFELTQAKGYSEELIKTMAFEAHGAEDFISNMDILSRG